MTSISKKKKTGNYDEVEGGSWVCQVLQEGQEGSLQIPSWVTFSLNKILVDYH